MTGPWQGAALTTRAETVLIARPPSVFPRTVTAERCSGRQRHYRPEGSL